jgi:hypothetical protein
MRAWAVALRARNVLAEALCRDFNCKFQCTRWGKRVSNESGRDIIARMAHQRNFTSLPWPKLDRIQLRAGWIEKSPSFFVERVYDGIPRGRWEFKYNRRNEWRCTKAVACYLRDHSTFEWRDPRDLEETSIPEDVQLKAMQFLSQEIEITPKLTKAQARKNAIRERNELLGIRV